MRNELEIVRFIRENPDWESVLSALPYGIGVSRAKFGSRNLVLLKYNQLESDFTIPVVRECRGIVLDEDTLEPVVVPFFKFFNYGEPNAASVDWKSAWISEKIDGSLCKMVKLDGRLLVGTNGCILADECSLPGNIKGRFSTFGELIRHTLSVQIPGYDENWLLSRMEEGWTYMFELTSPDNRIVVPHFEDRLSFIGCRNNSTLKEVKIYDHPFSKLFPTPKLFSFSSLDDVLKSTQELPWDQEGYVVTDRNFNRVKVKSAAYVMVHHIRGNDGNVSPRRALELILANECDEFLSYYPEFREYFDEMRSRFDAKVAELDAAYRELMSLQLQTRKDMAAWTIKHVRPSGFIFTMLNGKAKDADEWLRARPTRDILEILGYK